MRRRILVVAALIALLAFVPPFINLKRYQTRIAQTISASIGRNVTFSDVRLRLLPRPGFVFSGFVVAEDPAFGAEPMLSAQKMTASIRLSSLWRGRMEISRLSFDAPSLNLVRNERGLWNIGGSLRQASNVPVAPTAAIRPTTAARFPYIEASDARLNFKIGTVKQAFSLLETDVSLWLENPTQWRMRLEARPLRTDAYLGDTGTLKAEATFDRAHNEPLEDMPLKADFRWENAQLGQATWLLTGQDRGWRGNLDLRGQAHGTSKDLHLTSRVSVNGFRRYNISVADSMDFKAECSVDLVRVATPQDLRFAAERGECDVPVGGGLIRASGRGSLANKQYDVTVVVETVPLQSFVNFYRHAKLNVSDSLRATGTLHTDLRFDSATPCVTGTASLKDARFRDADLDVDLNIGNLLLQTVTPVRGTPRRGAAVEDACLTSNIAQVPLGGKTPLLVRLDAMGHGLRLALSGPVESEKALAATKAFGILARDYRAKGVMTLNASVNIQPREFRAAQWFGTAQSDELRFPQDLVLKRAALTFTGGELSLQRFTTSLPDLGTEVSGSVTWPLRCDLPPCPVRFALKATSLDIDAVNRAVNPNFRKRNWFYLPKFLGGGEAQQSPMSILLVFRGNGTVDVDRLTIRKLRLDSLHADATWDQNRLTLADASAKGLGGNIAGTLAIDAQPLVFAGKVTLQNVDLQSVAQLAGGPWVRGRGDAAGQFSFKSASARGVADSFVADFDFAAHNGALKGFAERGDLAFRQWSGQAKIKGRSLQIVSSSIAGDRGRQSLTGSVGAGLVLDLQIKGPASVTAIGGTLNEPEVRTHATPAESASNPANAPPPSPPSR